MNEQEIERPLAALRWLHVVATHRLTDELHLAGPCTLGSLYRSVLGLSMRQLSPMAFESAFGPDSGVQRPWWLSPPEVFGETRFAAGTVLRTRLSLHGLALTHLAEWLQALAAFELHGLGERRAKAVLTHVEVLTPEGPMPLTSALQDRALWGADAVWRTAAAEAASFGPEGSIAVETLTPLRLKQHAGGLVMQPPTLNTVVLACMTRIQGLLQLGADTPTGATLPEQGRNSLWLDPSAKTEWLDWARSFSPEVRTAHRLGVLRWSARQQQTMRMDGLVGNWTYAGRSSPAWPWLKLAEHLHLGGKNTVGFGALRVTRQD